MIVVGAVVVPAGIYKACQHNSEAVNVQQTQVAQPPAAAQYAVPGPDDNKKGVRIVVVQSSDSIR